MISIDELIARFDVLTTAIKGHEEAHTARRKALGRHSGFMHISPEHAGAIADRSKVSIALGHTLVAWKKARAAVVRTPVPKPVRPVEPTLYPNHTAYADPTLPPIHER